MKLCALLLLLEFAAVAILAYSTGYEKGVRYGQCAVAREMLKHYGVDYSRPIMGCTDKEWKEPK